MTPLAPWLQTVAVELRGLREQDRIPHAMLLSGSAGTGRADLLQWWVRWLHCQAPQADRACGDCDSCRQHAAGSHPDLVYLQPEEVGKEIKIDAVRKACFDLSLTSHYHGYRMLILRPAEALNRNAANALLKTLEEPPAATLLVLLAERPATLPATVRSRCRKLRVPMPTRAAAQQWLQDTARIDAGRAQALLDQTAWRPFAALALASETAGEAAKQAGVSDSLDAFVASPFELDSIAKDLSAYALPRLRADLLRWIEVKIRQTCLARGIDMAMQQQGKLLFEIRDQVMYWPIDRSSGLDGRLLIEEALIGLGRALAKRKSPSA